MAETADHGVPRLLDSAARITIAIFGGLRLWRNGNEADIGSQRQRIVLAELICAGGNVVSIPALVDALWDQDPAASAVNQVHRIVGQLRRTLEPGLSPHSTGMTILASGAGYRMASGSVQCDLYRMRELTREAKKLLSRGEIGSVGRCYEDALDLTQGALLGGLDSRVETRPEFLAVEQERVSAAIAAAEFAVVHGCTPQTLAAVMAIAVSVPLDEPLHALVIKLLSGAGRRADALTTFDSIRRRLADELGVDPGRELIAAYNDLLAADAELSRPVPGPVRLPKPAQLPRALPGFVHRADAEVLLAEELSAVGTVVITAFGGMAGIGKTALAVYWAHEVADQFPDGQLYINLRGFDPGGRASTPDEALNSLLEGLGESVASMTEFDTDSRAAKYRSVLAGRRMIVLLDNARDSEQVRPLLPGSADCLVIVTSRNRLTSLVAREAARFVPLGRLPPPEATELLGRRLGRQRLAKEPDAVAEIISGCAGLPIALSIVAARIATRPELTMSQVVSRLFAPGRGLDGLSTGEDRDDVRTVFSWSYESLSADCARLFRLLGAHPGPELSAGLAASLSGVGMVRTRRLTAELVEANLIAESAADRFVMHDLLRVYAGELLDAEHERRVAEQRVVEHFLLATRSAYNTFGRAPIADLRPGAADLFTEPCATIRDAFSWYAQERTSLFAVADLAMAGGMLRATALLVLDRRPMNQTLDVRSDSLHQSLRLLELIEAAGPGAGIEGSLLADLYRDAADRFHGISDRDSSERADSYYRRALTLFQESGDFGGQANTYRSLCLMASIRGDQQLTLEYAQEAVRLARLSERADLTALALHLLAEALMDLADHEQVVIVATQAINALRAAGLKYALPNAVSTLARGWLELGRWDDALAVAQTALDLIVDTPELVVEFFMLATAARAAAEAENLAMASKFVERFDQIENNRRIFIESVGAPTADHYFEMIHRVTVELENRRGPG